MLPSRFVFLLVVLLAVQAWAKPAGDGAEDAEYSEDDPRSEYSDDETQDEDEEEEPNNENDSTGPEDDAQILSESKSVRVRAGQTIRLPCLTKNADNLAIIWKKDDKVLFLGSANMDGNDRLKLGDNNTLVIVNAQENDSSNRYECSITANPPVSVMHRVLVDPASPVPPPVATTEPPAQPSKSVIRVTPRQRVEISAGETVTLGCETTIVPPPEIKWYHKNKKVGANMIADATNHITIKNANRHDAGQYQCLVEDNSEDPPIAGINVIVNYAPELEIKKEFVHSGVGVKSELTCVVHAHPEAHVSWFQGEREITPTRGKYRVKGNRTMHHLEIHHTTEDDFGKYKCVAVNDMGRAEGIVMLTGAPSQAIIYSGEQTENGLLLKWRLESYSPITEYKLQYRRKGEDKWNSVKPTVTNGNGNQFTVEHQLEELQPGSYEAILTARNGFGWSPPSAPHSFTGEYALEEGGDAPGSATATSPLGAMVAILLVVSSCAFTSL